MFDYAVETFSAKEKIGILFKEYDTLRTEIIGRAAGGYQLIAITAVIFAAVLGWRASREPDWIFWAGIGLVIATAVFFSWWTRRDINIIARRIRDIEKKINELSGETLLIWESELGSMAGGWLKRRAKSGSEQESVEPRAN
jgi:hypothetical protein